MTTAGSTIRTKGGSRLALFVCVASAGCGADEPAAALARDPAYWPFSAESPWNTPIGSGAVYEPETSPGLDLLLGGYLNVTDWTHPVYLASPDDPPRTFFRTDGSVCAFGRVPDDATPDPQADAHLHVIDETHRRVVENWACSRRADGDLEAEACVVNDLTDAGVYPEWHGVRAYGGSAIAGLIRRGELLAGIPHALAVSMENVHMNRLAPGGGCFVWPASECDGGDGASYGTEGNVFMGSLVALPPDVDIGALGLSPAGLELARALQDYGAYVVDAGSDLNFYAEPTAAAEVGLALYDDINDLAPLVRLVANHTATTPGGGGTPRRPPAPPFDR
ncbi:MAG: hypothetical protein IT373_13870 [Polyangiaceae bacterium]|nr:hypothetical protein [Polyangiaceae bacterium]